MATGATSFLAYVSGVLQTFLPTSISAGASNAGQIPGLNSSGKLDNSFLQIGPNYPLLRLQSGYYQALGEVDDTATTTTTLNASSIYFRPFTVGSALTISNLAIIVTTAAAGAVNVGVYSNNTGGAADLPQTLIAQSGALSTAAAGISYASIGSSITLVPNTIYWLAMIQSGTAVIKTAAAGALNASLGYNGSGSPAASLQQSGSGTTLPTTAGSTFALSGFSTFALAS